jgi:hypothetical protein
VGRTGMLDRRKRNWLVERAAKRFDFGELGQFASASLARLPCSWAIVKRLVDKIPKIGFLVRHARSVGPT